MSIQQTIVEKFVRKNEVDWARDMKAATALLKIFPEHGFWEWLEPHPTVSNLGFFRSKKNLTILKDRYSLFLQRKDLKESKEKLKESFDSKVATSYNQEDSKVGEDIPVVKKPITLKEFLNHGKAPETTAN